MFDDLLLLVVGVYPVISCYACAHDFFFVFWIKPEEICAKRERVQNYDKGE